MYPSVGAAIQAMIRYQERQASPRPAPWPDRAPGAASAADPWRYVFVKPTRSFAQREADDDRDPETVLLLFKRYDQRRVLTRLLIERQPIDEFRGSERHRARKARNHFARELCCRGLLTDPLDRCIQAASGRCPRFPHRD